jgi:hypothetical protein
MTSAPIRDPLADHLITPQNAVLLLIDYQPAQVASVRSMDHDLLVKNAVSTVRTIKAFGVLVVHSTVNVAAGQGPTIPELAGLLENGDCLSGPVGHQRHWGRAGISAGSAGNRVRRLPAGDPIAASRVRLDDRGLSRGRQQLPRP